MNWWDGVEGDVWRQPLPPMPAPFPVKPPGLGTRLARLLKRLGFQQKPGCGCAQRQRLLDEKVPLKWLK